MILFSLNELQAAEMPLGTVFFSSTERMALVARRNGATDEMIAAEEKKLAQKKGGDEENGSAEAPKSLPVSVSGIVSRGGGKSVVWLNGQPVAETALGSGQRSLRLSADQAMIDGKAVKVGETVDMISGERLTPLPKDAVKVRR